MPQYAIVQHSGYARSGHIEFARAVETIPVTPAEAGQVVATGGIVAPTYLTAERLAEAVNYPPGVTGLVPRALGRFAADGVAGLPAYLHPDTEAVTRWRPPTRRTHRRRCRSARSAPAAAAPAATSGGPAPRCAR
jgi:hypothetical protein